MSDDRPASHSTAGKKLTSSIEANELALPSPNGSARSTIDWEAALVDNERWLRRVLRCRVNDEHVVEDLLQEIALAVFRQQSKPIDPEKIAPWLYRLAIRYSINFHRQNGRKRKLAQRVNDMGVADQDEPGGEALNWLVQREQHSMVLSALQKLRAQDREILMLKYTENWTYRQLANHLGASVNTIEYRLLRAKRRLRKLLTSTTVYAAMS